MEVKEKNRLEILQLVEKEEKEDMWYVGIVLLNKLNEYDVHKAYFESRYDAEVWLTHITKDRPFYARCCDERVWNRTDELLMKKEN